MGGWRGGGGVGLVVGWGDRYIKDITNAGIEYASICLMLLFVFHLVSVVKLGYKSISRCIDYRAQGQGKATGRGRVHAWAHHGNARQGESYV